MTTEKLAGMAAIVNQEQQRIAVGPGSGHFISVRQVSYDAATMQRDTCGHAAKWPTPSQILGGRPSKSYTHFITPVFRHVPWKKFCGDTPTSLEVIGAHTLNFKPNFKFSR